MTPKVFHPDEPLRTFEIFSENDDGTVAVPRYWGEGKFGPAGMYAYDVHEADKLAFEGELRSELQREAASASIKQLQEVGGGVLCAMTGFGKFTKSDQT